MLTSTRYGASAFTLVLVLFAQLNLGSTQDNMDTDQLTLIEYTRELVETLRKQVEWARMATDQLSTMMGPKIGTHFTEMAGYCVNGVSVSSHWNITTTDCLYECLSSDECAGYNFYTPSDKPGSTRCEMVTVNLFCTILMQPDCVMFIRRWRNNQFGSLFSGGRIASAIMKVETAPTMYECIGLCKHDDRCMHISYRQPDMSCTMHATGGGAMIEDFSWIAYGRVVRCPDFYIRFQRACFRVFKSSNESWSNARTNCLREGAHLVNILTPEENQFMRDLISREAPNLNWWIGAYENNGEWLWVDTPETDAQLSFHHWSDNPSNDPDARCAFFDVATMKWDRTECDGTTETSMFYYTCEAPATQLDHPIITPLISK